MKPWPSTPSSSPAPASGHDLLTYHGARIAVALLVAAITYLLFPASPAVDYPVLDVGSVATDDVIAPFAFEVPKDPTDLAAERAELAASLAPVYAFVPAALDSARLRLGRFATNARRAAALADPAVRGAAITRAAADEGIRLAASEVAYLAGPGRLDLMVTAAERATERWLVTGVARTDALDHARGLITLARDSTQRTIPADSVLTFSRYLSRARLFHPDPSSPPAEGVYRKVLTEFFHPTISYDRVATERVRQELSSSIEPTKYELRAGEKIVGAHEVVGREEFEKMRALRDALQQQSAGRRSVGRVAGAVLFNALVLAIFGLTLVLFRPQLYRSLRVLLVIASVFTIVIAASAIIAHVPESPRPELVPVAFAAVLLCFLFDPRIAMIAAMVLAVLIGGQSEFRGTNALFLNLIGGTAAAFTVRVVRRRDQTYASMLAIATAYLLASVAIGLTLGRPLDEIAASAGWGALNAVVSVSVALVLLPPAEEFAGVDTYFKLLEWSDLNRPLLQRLSLEAPGTYAHSMAIASLAESASNAIGANGLLARVGAYYHDIGKLRKPQYFVENQPKGRNPHDKLKPTMSASIIRNHVSAGLELAEEYKLPRSVRAFITEHHGTGPISYFLEKAKERDALGPNTTDFAYPGPLPQSAETAVCMLADGVEAAVRVLAEPTPERVRDVVERIVRQRVDQGQLREAPLTLRQLELIKDQFVRSLSGMHHSRLDYPAASGGITSEFVAR